VRMVIGVLLVLVGAVWFLQGIDLLGGSFMSGQILWSVIGAPMIFVGALLIRASRASQRRDRP
jgi:uncharacterized membrane protein HdeD (DUF308 family)